MELGQYLSQYLAEHNLSYRDFAKLSEISHTYIFNICNEKTSRGQKPVLSYEKLKQIAKGMGIDINELLSIVDVDIEWGKQKKETLSNKESVLLNYFRELNPEGQKAALSMIEGLFNSGIYKNSDDIAVNGLE